MDNVPLFCLNRGFRKVCWEELHEPMAKDARFLKLMNTDQRGGIKHPKVKGLIDDDLSADSF